MAHVPDYMHTRCIYYIFSIVLYYMVVRLLHGLLISPTTHSADAAHYDILFASVILHYKKWPPQATVCNAKAYLHCDEGRGYSVVPTRHDATRAREDHSYFQREANAGLLDVRDAEQQYDRQP